jgi:integrase/recombinase XerC
MENESPVLPATGHQAGALVPAPPIAAALLPASPAEQLLRAFLSGRSAETLRAYRRDVEDFAAFAGVDGPAAAAQLLLAGGHGQANAAVLAYRAHLLGRTLSPATINRRLAAERSLVALARTLGMLSRHHMCRRMRWSMWPPRRTPRHKLNSVWRTDARKVS